VNSGELITLSIQRCVKRGRGRAIFPNFSAPKKEAIRVERGEMGGNAKSNAEGEFSLREKRVVSWKVSGRAMCD